MKRVLKFLLPILILTVITTIFMIPSSAASNDSGYAVWASEEEYLANPSRPMAVYSTNQLTTDAIGGQGKGFVLCYGDVTVTADVQLSRAQNIVIDLGGNKLTASKKIIVNGASAPSWCEAGSLTIRNGEIVHTAGQFIQTRPNSEVYLEGLNILEQATSGNFVYDASLRILHFKDCTVTVDESASLKMISLAPGYSGVGADILYRNEEGKGTDYIRNVVFENTVFIDNSKVSETSNKVTIIEVRSSTNADFVNVSFIYGSTFNQLRNNFLDVLNANATVSVNISKGARFATEEVPVTADKFEVNYYDSIEVVNKHRVELGKKTDIFTGGAQNPDNPELIWGKSGDDAYPYQLCQYLCDVTWNVKSEHLDEDIIVTESGYADGLKLNYAVSANTYFTNDDGKVYVERLLGWSSSEGGTDVSDYVTLNSPSSNYYAVFAEYPVYAVEYDSAEKENIISGITDSIITAQHFNSFKDGSYIYLFEDLTWGTDINIELSDITLTIDLGGKTFYKSKVESKNSGILNLDGTDLTVKGGTLDSFMTGIALLNGGAKLTFDGVTVLYDRVPAITVEDGSVSIKNSKVEQASVDTDIPFIVYTLDGTAEVTAENSEIAVSGPLSTVIPGESGNGDASLSVTDCGTVYADSLFALYESVAGGIADGAELKLTVYGTNVVAREMFDDCASALDAEYSILGTCMFTSKPESENGVVVLPLGLKIVAIDGSDFAYTLGLDELTVKFNMELSLGFKANFYIPTSYPVTYTETYLEYAKAEDMTVVTIDGNEYYLVSVYGISAADCLDTINVRIGYVGSDGKDYASEIAYEPIDYFNELLSGEDPLNRKLAAAAVKYVASAYEYNTAVAPMELQALLASPAYTSSLRDSAELPKDGVKTELGNIGTAFESAQLYLSSDLFVRFNIKDGFSGTLVIDGTSYTVENGLCNGEDHIQIAVSAYMLYAKAIEVSGASADSTVIAGTYSLNDYVLAFSEDEGALSEMLTSFYAYCYEAFVYDNGGVIPPYIDHTPPLDAELS